VQYSKLIVLPSQEIIQESGIFMPMVLQS